MLDRRLRSAARPVVRGVRRLAGRIDAARVRARIDGLPEAVAAEVESVRRARNGTRIVATRAATGPGTVIKLTDRSDGAALLLREADVLASVRGRLDDPDLRALLPEEIGRGASRGWTYLVESRLPGVAASPLLDDPAASRSILAEASDVAARLHGSTATAAGVRRDDLDAWVDRPLALVAELAARPARSVAPVADELRNALGDCLLERGVVHGDLWSENLLVDPTSHRVVGIVDWDSAELAGLRLHDQLHLVLYARKVVRRTPIGTELCRALAGEPSSADQLPLPAAERGGWDAIGLRAALVLDWLRLVSSNLARQPAETRRRRWIDANVSAVLACL